MAALAAARRQALEHGSALSPQQPRAPSARHNHPATETGGAVQVLKQEKWAGAEERGGVRLVMQPSRAVRPSTARLMSLSCVLMCVKAPRRGAGGPGSMEEGGRQPTQAVRRGGSLRNQAPLPPGETT